MKDELEKIYDESGHRLFTCALAVTRCPDLAEDAVHEAFTRLLRMRRCPKRLAAYVFRSVRNAAVDQVRRDARTGPLSEDSIFDSSDNPRQAAGKKEFLGLAAKALKTLSKDERETVIEHLYSDLSFREIAELRERSVSTVASWYRRGLQKMRDQIKE